MTTKRRGQLQQAVDDIDRQIADLQRTRKALTEIQAKQPTRKPKAKAAAKDDKAS